jgi:chromate transporter
MPNPPSLAEIFACFVRIGTTAYGGPAMLPLFRERIVTGKGWLSAEGFKLGLSLCQTIPGGTLMQMSAYTGLTLRGLPGALAGFIGFALPATALITALSALYHHFQGLALTRAFMAGLSVVVLAIVLLAVTDFGQKYARGLRRVLLTLAAAGLFLAGVGPGVIIASAALAGLVLFRHPAPDPTAAPRPVANLPALAVLAALALGWLCLVFVLDPVLFTLCLSMAKADLLAFGGFGAFPVLYHEAVDLHGWMDSATFLDGMALAQVTPGPILLASSFVGYHLRGVLGAVAGAVWIFTPSFFILTAAVPISDRLLGSALFRRALDGVLSTLGGLILAVGLTLARSTDWTWPKALLFAAALLALWRKINPLWVVLAGAGIGATWL